MADNELIIKIGANADQFDAAIEDVKKKTENLEEQLGKIAKISAVAFGALVAEIGLAVKAYAESEAASRKLTVALENQGFSANKTAAEYKKFAEEVQRKTGIDDDALVSSQALLQNFIGQQKVSKELTEAIADLSTQTGDLDSAAEILGRGIQGNVRGLKQYGIVIDEGLTKQERMAQILEKVNQRYAGQAEAANKGLGGIKGLKDAFSSVQEEIGARFAPAITRAIQVTTNLLNFIKDSPALIGFASSFLKVGTVITGLIAGFSSIGLAIVKFSQVMKLAQLAVTSFGVAGRIAVGATGIGVLLLVLGEIYLNWSTIWPKMQQIFSAFANNIGTVGSGLASILTGVFTLDRAKISAGLNEVKNAFTKGFDEINKASIESGKQRTDSETAEDTARLAKKKALADKAAAEEAASEQRKINIKKAQNEELLLESQGASDAMLALKKQEVEVLQKLDDENFEAQRSALIARFEELQALQEEQAAIDAEQRTVFRDEILLSNEEFQALSEEQRANFLARNQEGLQQQILTEKNVKQAAAQQSLNDQIQNNNRFLLEQQKFGTAYAAINSVMHSSIYQGSKQAFGELSALTQSENSKLKAIGKVAAIANIIIRTAESAMNIYAGFSTIPIVGPALGVAGAASAVLFGAEQLGKVNAAAMGGIATGGIPGKDSIPFMLTPGELVTPTKNFDEVIGSVRAAREAEKMGGSVGGSTSVMIGFDGPEASQVLTARQNEDRALGISRESST